ncbi:MAG: efflux RND transporter periplasmic adaptor subunit, partial [bacterium]
MNTTNIAKATLKDLPKNNMKSKFQKFKEYCLKHKKTSVAACIVLLLLIYWLIKVIFPAGTVTMYTVTDVQTGSMVTNVTGSGQVSASNQISLKAKASGDILKINVKTGQEVKAGQTIAELDNPSAYLNLQSAQIAYQKLVQPADASTRIQAENDLNSTKQSIAKADNDLNNAYDSGYNSIASTYLDLTDVVNGVNSLLYSSSGFLSDQNIGSLTSETKNARNSAGSNFDKIKNEYQSALTTYKASSRSNATDSIDTLIKNTYTVTKDLSSVLKDLKNTVDYIKNQDPNTTNSNLSASETTAANNLTNWIGKVNGDLTDISSS